jgi:Bifunctional DNA primase/polymerase, N-terminal
MSDLLTNALAYAKHGLSVIPIQPREKKSLIRWESYQNQPAKVDELKTWWTQWPDANEVPINSDLPKLPVEPFKLISSPVFSAENGTARKSTRREL